MLRRTGRAAFIEWAVEFFKTKTTSKVDSSELEKLPEIPQEHLGALAKDIQESYVSPSPSLCLSSRGMEK